MTGYEEEEEGHILGARMANFSLHFYVFKREEKYDAIFVTNMYPHLFGEIKSVQRDPKI